MDNVTRAFEAAVKVNLRHRITGVYPTTSEEAVRDILLAFLKAMPDSSRFSDITDHSGVKLGEVRLPNLPSALAAAIEEAQG